MTGDIDPSWAGVAGRRHDIACGIRRTVPRRSARAQPNNIGHAGQLIALQHRETRSQCMDFDIVIQL